MYLSPPEAEKEKVIISLHFICFRKFTCAINAWLCKKLLLQFIFVSNTVVVKTKTYAKQDLKTYHGCMKIMRNKTIYKTALDAFTQTI